MQNNFGLIGRTLKHSFSKGYFTEKFEKLDIDENNQYHLFELAEIEEFPELVQKYGSSLKGLNVTIPYKQAIMPFLDEIDEAAEKIGAVNTIKFIEDNNSNTTKIIKLKGYNTDYWGFRWTIEKWNDFQEINPKKALVLGKGGAAKAVIVALNDLGLEVQIVSRKKEADTITYEELTKEVIDNHLLIINSTPLGMYPNEDSFPEIPYHFLTKNHLLYDLVYNPLETEFLKKGKEYGIKSTHSGLEMLHGQAEKAWEIWGMGENLEIITEYDYQKLIVELKSQKNVIYIGINDVFKFEEELRRKNIIYYSEESFLVKRPQFRFYFRYDDFNTMEDFLINNEIEYSI